MIIRLAQPDDLPAIVAIYNQAILTRRSTAEMIPVQVADKQAWFAEHDPLHHPIFVAEVEHKVVGWCSLSTYRPGRQAFIYTAEVSYYVDSSYHRQGIASALIKHAIAACPTLKIKTLLAMLLDRNQASINLLKKMGFEKWGEMPRVVDFDGEECNHLYYGKRVDLTL